MRCSKEMRHWELRLQVFVAVATTQLLRFPVFADMQEPQMYTQAPKHTHFPHLCICHLGLDIPIMADIRCTLTHAFGRKKQWSIGWGRETTCIYIWVFGLNVALPATC